MTWWTVVLPGTYGVFLMVTSIGFGWTGIGIGPSRFRAVASDISRRVRGWMIEAGVGDVAPAQFLGATALVAFVGGIGGGAAFGGVLPPLAIGLFAGALPATAYRMRRVERRVAAEESWPAMIEEIRLLTSSAGRSVPQALFEVGRRTPLVLQPAFLAAQRSWTLSTDLERSLDLLRAELASATADTVIETLLIAHELGGVDLDRRLAELAEDRRVDLQARKDARAKQAGVRFARRFVIIVPAGMAFAGMSLGNGRSSYASTTGQLVVLGALSLVAVCWWWSGRMLQLPDGDRVFRG